MTHLPLLSNVFFSAQSLIRPDLKLNTMQLETPGGNHCYLMTMMYRIKDWFIHLLILSHVYEHDKQKTIIY